MFFLGATSKLHWTLYELFHKCFENYVVCVTQSKMTGGTVSPGNACCGYKTMMVLVCNALVDPNEES